MQSHNQTVLTSFWHPGSCLSCQKLEWEQEQNDNISFYWKDFFWDHLPLVQHHIQACEAMLLKDQGCWHQWAAGLQYFKTFLPTLGQSATLYCGVNNRTVGIGMMNTGCCYQENAANTHNERFSWLLHMPETVPLLFTSRIRFLKSIAEKWKVFQYVSWWHLSLFYKESSGKVVILNLPPFTCLF